MSEPHPNSEERLDEAFAAYIQAKESGHSPDVEAILAQYPELADDVSTEERFEGLTAQVRGVASTCPHVLAEPQCILPGTVIGDYEVLQEIGRNGQGVVYQVRHVKFRKQVVALKMPLSGHRATEKETERFIAEVENQAKLDHPNIVPIKGGGEYEGRLYFTMKLIENGSLAERIGGLMSSREAAGLMAKIARAVHHAHQRRILHRDLKPSNILLDAEGEPYVADFGLSKTVEGEHPINTGYMVGAPAYMPPEQIRGEATTLSDVYGLGAILYWILTHQPPFQSDGREQTLQKVLDDAPEHPTDLNTNVDPDLEAICLRCLQKNPDERYRSAEGLAKELDRWLDGRETSVRSWSPSYRLLRWCQRNRAVASLSALAIVLVTTTAIVATVGWVMLAEAHRLETKRLEKTVGEIIDYDDHQRTEVEKVAHDDHFINILTKTLADPDLTELRQKLNDPDLKPEERKSLQAQFRKHPKRTELQDLMEKRQQSDAQQPVHIFSWFVTDPHGLQLARGPERETLGMNFAYRTYFQNGPDDREPSFRASRQEQLKKTRMSFPLHTDKTNAWVVVVSTPVCNKEGKFLGVVGVMVEIGPVLPDASGVGPGHDR